MFDLRKKRYYNIPLIFMLISLLVIQLIFTTTSYAKNSNTKVKAKQMENINRSLVAVKTDDGIFVSWRMLGTDNKNISFDIYRNNKKINSKPIKSSTNYIDKKGTSKSKYYIKVLNNGKKKEKTEKVSVWNENSLSIPLNKPEDGEINGASYSYRANDCSVGDLDGDGEYEIVLKWDPTNSKDSSKSGYTGNVYIDAYEMTGEQLWRINMGINVRAGAHYTQMLVYDFDGNGKSEIALKTSDGTIAGDGEILGDETADYRKSNGFIITGTEYLTVFEGKTGKILDSIDYEPARGEVSDWGDTYGNRCERNLAAVAYLDGQKPSFVMARGYYTGTVGGVKKGQTILYAYNFRKGKISTVWGTEANEEENSEYIGQGNHSMSIADVDNDSKDEIIYGACTFDNDGSPLYSTKLGHGDALHVSDFVPSNPGLEVFDVHESKSSKYGLEMHDAETGEILFGHSTGFDTGRGLASDVDPTYEGAESWAIGSNVDVWAVRIGYMFNAAGELISDMESIPSSNSAIWWDGDLLRELQDHNFNSTTGLGVPTIDKWDYVNKELVNMETFTGTYTNNWSKGNSCLQADLFGDWREEIALRSEDSTELLIYTTTDLTSEKIYTLMHDPVYRTSVAWQNSAYNQPPHTGFFLGDGMKKAPMPKIYLK
ncbi:MAG: rhamnogalacturonan lyase [Clostridiales bacterium]